jgi:hypothetical protein
MLVEEIIALLGFSFGASLGIGVTRSLGEGARPVVRNVMKLGIRAWDAGAAASAAVREEVARPDGAEPSERTGRTRRGSTGAQQIVIARS